ncbi:MAG: alpha/beta fold hydrolase [Gammaproteobacteria bacterium]|nr:alpha/beta fold hydrolase [Gammaproteobacteria bacterium]
MSEEAPAARAVSFAARDGRVLAGLLVEGPRRRGALLVNGATGILREFYLKFAAYCATRGYAALVYDYRGMGASAAGTPAHERARMSDWGRLDMPAALDWLHRTYPTLPLATVGHSVGGQLIGCMDNHALAAAHVLIAVGTAYWGREQAPFRYQALAFWWLYGPWQLWRHGYVPRGTLWRGAALPPEVFRQWRRWGLSPAPFGRGFDPELAGAQFEAVRAPLLSWGFTDDPIATPAAIEALLTAYPHASIERRLSSPRQLGVRALGHHGFFAAGHRDSLWADALDWLDARS